MAEFVRAQIFGIPHQHGMKTSNTDLYSRNDFRDHQPVRTQFTATQPTRQSYTEQIHRYSDLQPVGMGAFGLVWYETLAIESKD